MAPHGSRIFAEQYFPGAIQIVDLYHARQHLWESDTPRGAGGWVEATRSQDLTCWPGGSGQLTPAAAAAFKYRWTVLWAIRQLRPICCCLSPRGLMPPTVFIHPKIAIQQ
jgi:hypothetical protein